MNGSHLDNSSSIVCDGREAIVDAGNIAPESFIEDEPTNEDNVSPDPKQRSYDKLNHLRNLNVLSLIGYEEIAESSTDARLQSFADVILRQRSARQRALYKCTKEVIGTRSTGDAANRALLRSLWRLAIVSLQRRDFSTFSEYAQRAEAYLEEAYLAAAESLNDPGLAEELRDYALMIYGARTFFEEFTDTLRHGAERDEQLARSAESDLE
jgi:hypothetical protein